MDLILDTCGLLSLIGLAKKKLTRQTLDTIQASENVYVSSCTMFELAIKHKKGGLDLGIFSNAGELWSQAIPHFQLSVIPVSAEHFLHSVNLPDHHLDPFDRIIIAQSIQGNLTVVTYDRVFTKYNLNIIA